MLIPISQHRFHSVVVHQVLHLFKTTQNYFPIILGHVVTKPMGLGVMKRWLSGYKHLLLFRGTRFDPPHLQGSHNHHLLLWFQGIQRLL